MSRSKGPTPRTGPKALTGSPEAKRLAAGILEVLSGIRDTGEAAKTMGISPMRYYLLETRALQGLIAALEPRKRGKVRSVANELEAVKGENQRLQREVTRLQALVRAAQRSMGMAPQPDKPDERKEKGKRKGRRRRRGTVRAMRAAAALRAGGEDSKLPAGRAEAKPEAAVPPVEA